MRLITIPIIILIIFLILAIFVPVLLLQASEPVVPPDIRQNAAQVLAEISSFLGRYDTSIDLYDYLILAHPESAIYYGKMADYLHRTGKYEETITALDAAIGRDRNNPDYLLKKARLTRVLNRIPESNTTYHRIDQVSPQTAEGFALTGDAALDQSRYIEALNRYSQALSMNPKDAATWEKQGDVIFALLTIPTAGLFADSILRQRNLYAEGIRSYENAMNLNPARYQELQMKIEKRSEAYIPKTINELESRYTKYRYLG